MRGGHAAALHERSQRIGKLEHGLARRKVAHPDAVPVRRGADPGAERLGERLFRREALRQVACRQAMALESLQFRLAKDLPREPLAVLLQHGAHTLDLHDVGADAVDHFAARSINCFISRTASRMPTNTARLTIAWPICSSRTPASAATGSTLK